MSNFVNWLIWNYLVPDLIFTIACLIFSSFNPFIPRKVLGIKVALLSLGLLVCCFY